METYFHKDPRVREWVDQITEKIFTVCLLSGVDSDAEFQGGCQIVMKIVSLLQEIPSIPAEFLADGVKQLLEQQLPDTRVIESFPTYKATMDRMVRESILMVIDCQNKEAFNNLASSEENVKENVKEDVKEVEEDVEELRDDDLEIHVAEVNEEFLTESAISALTTICIPQTDIQTREGVFATEAKVGIEVGIEKVNSVAPPISVDFNTPDIKPVADQVKQEPLKRVLSNIFPNSTVYWNKSLMGLTVLAQVEDILICLYDAEHPLNLKKLYNKGWKVLECNTEDLNFPRRLERGIREIQRSGKKSLTV